MPLGRLPQPRPPPSVLQPGFLTAALHPSLPLSLLSSPRAVSPSFPCTLPATLHRRTAGSGADSRSYRLSRAALTSLGGFIGRAYLSAGGQTLSHQLGERRRGPRHSANLARAAAGRAGVGEPLASRGPPLWAVLKAIPPASSGPCQTGPVARWLAGRRAAHQLIPGASFRRR